MSSLYHKENSYFPLNKYELFVKFIVTNYIDLVKITFLSLPDIAYSVRVCKVIVYWSCTVPNKQSDFILSLGLQCLFYDLPQPYVTQTANNSVSICWMNKLYCINKLRQGWIKNLLQFHFKIILNGDDRKVIVHKGVVCSAVSKCMWFPSPLT